MLPSIQKWEEIVSNLGLKNSDHVIIYDNSDVYSSCRVWDTFIYFGHDINLVSVLDGDFKKWLKEKRPTSKEQQKFLRQTIKLKRINLLL